MRHVSNTFESCFKVSEFQNVCRRCCGMEGAECRSCALALAGSAIGLENCAISYVIAGKMVRSAKCLFYSGRCA